MRFWGKENQGANLGGWGLFFEEVLTLRLTDGNVKVHGRKRLAQEGDGRSTGGQEACCVLLLAAAAINSCALVHWAAKCVRGWVPQCECGHRSGELGTGLGCPLWQAGTSISRGRYRGQERHWSVEWGAGAAADSGFFALHRAERMYRDSAQLPSLSV